MVCLLCVDECFLLLNLWFVLERGKFLIMLSNNPCASVELQQLFTIVNLIMIVLITFINFMFVTWTSRTILAWAAEPHPLSAEHVYTPEWCRLVLGNVNWSAFTWNTMYFDQVVENERGLELKGSFFQPTRLCAILSFYHLSLPSSSSWSLGQSRPTAGKA